MSEKKSKLKTIKTPIGPVWVYSSVQQAIAPLKKRDNLKIITAVGAVIIILLTFLYAGFIDDRQGGKAFSGAGAGTTDDPFRISTCTQLQEMDNAGNTAHYVVTNNMDCSDTINWNGGAGFTPIYHNANQYVFSLDGRNHTISGLYISNNDTPSNAVGMFASLGGADVSIRNLNITGAVVDTSEDIAGILVGYLGSATVGTKARVEHVNVEGNLMADSNYAGIVAGIAYIVDTKITHSSASGGVDALRRATTQQIGGLAGSADVIENSYSTAYVDVPTTGTTSLFCGGLVGRSANVVNSYAAARVDCPGSNSSLYTGGLIGYTGSGSGQVYDNNFSVAQVVNSSALSRGGLLGGGDTTKVADDNYYDRTATGQTKCAWSASGDPCIAVNTDGLSPNYFKNTTAVAPLSSWDFASTWQTTSEYPTIRPALLSPDEPSITSNVVTSTSSLLTWSAPVDNGGSSVTDYKIYYKEQASGTWNLWADSVSTTTTTTITGLTPATSYDFRVRAVNSVGDGLYSAANQSMTTDAPTAPSVATSAATNITQASVTLNGITLSDGIIERGFQFGTSINYTFTDYDNTLLEPVDSPITVNLTGLTCSTSYHFRAFATNGGGTGYGEDLAFTTAACDDVPEVTTVSVTNIDDNSATFTGLVSPRWLLAPGFEWGTDPTFSTILDGSEVTSSLTYTEADAWGEYGSGYGQNIGALAIEHDTSNNAYVLDAANCKVSKYNPAGSLITEWGTCGSASGQFNSPRAMAIDNFNNIYVADSYNHRIQKFDSEGNYILEWGSEGMGDGQFSYVHPRGIAVDNNNYIYVSDGNYNRIQKFDSNGNYIAQWGSTGSGNGQFSGAWRIAADSSNNIYVNDYNNDRIQKFDSNGNYLLQWGSVGTGNGQFEQAVGLEVDSLDNVYVVDEVAGRVQRFDSSGNYIDTWGSTGSGENQFISPVDISFDRLDNAYVVSMYSSDPVKKFSYGFELTVPDSLICNTDYYVRAYSTSEGINPGGIGNTLPFTTTPCPGDVPNPPDNLRTTSSDGTSATLVWDAPSYAGGGAVTDYLIEFRESNQTDWTPYPNTLSTSTYETVTSLSPGVSYFFRVFAVNDYGVSLSSNTVQLAYTIDISLNTILLNSGEIKNGDTVTYRNVFTNNGPGTSTVRNDVPLAIHIVPAGFNYSAASSSSVACADGDMSNFPYLEQFYSGSKFVACLPIANTTLLQGESLTYDIIGTADSNFANGATIKGFGVNFYDANRELVEFGNQLEILSGIFVAFGGDLSQPSSSTDIFTLPFNNISTATYSYTAPSGTPSPSPTVTTSTTPTPSPSTTPSPSPEPETSPTIQPEPELPNPLFPKYPPEGVKVPQKDVPPAAAKSSFLTGFVPEGILDTIRMTPNAVALALPFFIILVLIALAVLYARQAWLEYRTIAKVRGIIERYHSTKEASQNFVALTSHYLNTPVNILQASAELLASTKALSSANIDKLDLAIKNLAEDIKKLVTGSQKTTSRVAESTTELDKLKMKNPLLSIFVLIPSGIVVIILFILNLLFTATDRYSLSFALVIAQITALILGIGILALSWHSFKRNQASRDALKHQLTLEADILARRVAFITQSYSDLNADLGLVKALTKDIPATNTSRKPLQNGITMLEDILKTFGRLINFSRPLEALPAPLSVAPVIENAIQSKQDSITEKKITIDSQVPVNLTAPLTQEALEQLMSSVLDNAIKFNKEGGNIKICTKNTQQTTKIIFQDNGVGIDKAKLSQLMTPFSRATDVLKFDYEGIGLNLYLDKVLLEQIGGELHISSTQNKGTTVTLTIPEVKA